MGQREMTQTGGTRGDDPDRWDKEMTQTDGTKGDDPDRWDKGR